MRILMLGWEFPPFISGGLGTACFGLTKALSQRNAQVTFVLPKAIDSDYGSHVKLKSPQAPQAAGGDRAPESVASTYELPEQPELEHVEFKAVPSHIPSPYVNLAPPAPQGHTGARRRPAGGPAPTRPADLDRPQPSVLHGPMSPGSVTPADGLYAGDLVAETQRYADLCVDLARGEAFDVIHAHDWLTFPAGMAVAALTGKPLVVHVHSTEFDRSGANINQPLYDIERRGMHAATRIIAVSHFTRQIIQQHYGISSGKVSVVYNGIDHQANGQLPPRHVIRRGEKIVLFLGRITMQKGPEYFVQAAKKVLEKYKKVRFVMAGSGDKIRQTIELCASEGLGQHVLFTGFLTGPDVERVFKMADVYVMPSVSEPFGIAPLEAISNDVPVIISKTSGVSEVLNHALKVDFWDTNEMANKIVAVLRHPPLSQTMREHADVELRSLTWSDAADKCLSLYQDAVASMPRR